MASCTRRRLRGSASAPSPTRRSRSDWPVTTAGTSQWVTRMSIERILVVSAHPDDEALGCGGTLLKAAAQGAEIHWIIATQTWAPKWSDEYRKAVLTESNAVGQRIAPGRVRRLGLPAARLEAI